MKLGTKKCWNKTRLAHIKGPSQFLIVTLILHRMNHEWKDICLMKSIQYFSSIRMCVIIFQSLTCKTWNIYLLFSLTRETDTKKSWAILQNFNSWMINFSVTIQKEAFWCLAIRQNWRFGQFYHSKMKFLQNCWLHLCQLLAVGSWIKWFISSWEKNNCCYKLRKLTFFTQNGQV